MKIESENPLSFQKIDFLQRNDEALRRLRDLVEMPELIT